MKLKLFFMVVLLAQTTVANLMVSEIMYAPTQTASETDSEWIEIYNNGEETIDLAKYKINGYNFDDVALEPKSYLAIARELLDSNDEDLESFESVWGNNDGAWTLGDSVQAVDGHLTLNNAGDTINISIEDQSILFTYVATEASKSGFSLIWDGSSFIDGRFGGTPGRGEISDTELPITVIVIENTIKVNSLLINNKNSTTLLPFQESFQISGSFEGKIKNISLLFQDTQYPLTINNSTFSGTIPLQSLQPGNYESFLILTGETKTHFHNFSLMYPAVIATKLHGNVTFGELGGGSTSSTQNIWIENAGNIPVKISLAATELYNNKTLLPKAVLEILFENTWTALNNNLELGPLSTSSNLSLAARLNLPTTTLPGKYQGYLKVVSYAS